MKPFFVKLLSIILISCLGFAVYSNTFHCAFHLDDWFSITDNFAIRNLSDLQTIWNFLPRRFVLYLSIALNYHFNQLDVFGYHVFNLAVHLICAVLVWWFILLTFSTPAMKELPAGKAGNKINPHANLIALLAGLLFVSHPIQTQAVTYIVQRAASMAALFYVATLCFYAKSRLLQTQKPSSSLGWFYYTCGLITATMSMFTKESAITLPLMIFIYEFSFFRGKKNFHWGHTVPFLLTLLIIPLTIYTTESVQAQAMRGPLANGVVEDGPPGISSAHYFFTQMRVIVTYLRLLFVPIHQNLDYEYPISQSLFEPPTLISFLFLSSILFSAIKSFSKYRLVSFSILWFFLTLAPESSFLPIRDVIFEHRLYLPLVGYSMFLVSGLYYFPQKNILITMTIVLTMIIGCNTVLTYQRNKVWKNEFTLWDDTVQKSPHKARPRNNRGKVYLDEGKLTEAMSDFNASIEASPGYALPYNNRGSIYTKQGDLTRALSDYTKAVELDTTNVLFYVNRGYIYDKMGRLNEAMSDYNKAIELNPNYADAYNNRGLIYAKENNLAQALADYSKAIELNPKFEKAYDNRGVIYDKQGDAAQALADYNKAIELNPDYAATYNNRGTAWEKQKNFTEAMADYNKAIELNPKFAEPYYNLGNIYYLSGNFAQAMANYNRAIKLRPLFAESYYNRGTAYFHMGKLTQAMNNFTMAIEKNPKYAEAYSNRGLIYSAQGNTDLAIADFTKGIELDAKNTGAYYNRGLAYCKKNNFLQAIADFTKTIELSPKMAGAYNNRGFIYATLGNINQALLDYDKAIELDPTLATAYTNRAVIYYRFKEYDKAWANVHEAENLKAVVNSDFINTLKQASNQ